VTKIRDVKGAIWRLVLSGCLPPTSQGRSHHPLSTWVGIWTSFQGAFSPPPHTHPVSLSATKSGPSCPVSLSKLLFGLCHDSVIQGLHETLGLIPSTEKSIIWSLFLLPSSPHTPHRRAQALLLPLPSSVYLQKQPKLLLKHKPASVPPLFSTCHGTPVPKVRSLGFYGPPKPCVTPILAGFCSLLIP
jgi:hypothetical protein